MIRVLSLLLLLCGCGNLLAQDLPDSAAVRRFQSHVLRGDSAAARREQLNLSPSLRPAERALLDAAQRDPLERPEALLVVAGLYLDDPVADTALCAAIAHYLALRGWDPAVHDTVFESDSDGLSEDFDALGFLTSLRKQLTVREAKGGQRDVLADTRNLLDTACVTQRLEYPVRVRPGQVVPVPTPLAAPLRVRFFQSAGAVKDLYLTEPRAAVVATYTLAVGAEAEGLKVPAPGRYIMELQTIGEPWRSLRAIEVSDLEVIVQRAGRALVVGVTFEGEPLMDAEVHVDGRPVTLTGGAGVAVIPDLAAVQSIEVVSGEHRAVIAISSVRMRQSLHPRKEYLGHVVVDRPLYRRGETVKGRVVLQQMKHSAVTGLASLETHAMSLSPVSKKVSVRVHWSGSRGVTIEGQTDTRGVFAFTAAIPKGANLGLGYVELKVIDAPEGDRKAATTIDVDERALFTIRQFKRPPVLLEVAGPDEVDRGDVFKLSIAAEFASGSPAGGLHISARAFDDVGVERVVTAQLGRDGRFELPVATDCFDHGDSVRVDVSVTAPDGQVLSRRHWVRIRGENVPAIGLRLVLASDLVAGGDLFATVSGRPHEKVLVTMFRGVPRDTAMHELDAGGELRIGFKTRAEDWPSVDVIVTSADRAVRKRVHLAHPRGVLGIELETDRKRYGPGEEVLLKVRTSDSAGAASSRVCIAVVDERVFAAARDRVPHPQKSLRPSIGRLDLSQARSLVPIAGIRLLGFLLWNGRVLDLPSSIRAGARAYPGPSGAAAAAGASARTSVRTNFQATAFFLPDLQTDSDGLATVRFRVPDDLTTWRVTAYAVDTHSRGARVRMPIVTRRALAVTPMLPRQLVVGDQVRVPVIVDLAAGQKHQNVELAYESPSSSVSLEAVMTRCAATPGVAKRAEFKLDAREVGRAEIGLNATGDETSDASRRQVPVVANMIIRPRTVTRRVQKRSELASPGHGSQELILLGRRDALLAHARKTLEVYPYGCVEQTLSKILPYFYTARTAVQSGRTRDELTASQKRRMLKGMRRLRSLQVSPSGGFAWWPGESGDAGMSALVITGLVIARDGGFDPRQYGLQFHFDQGLAARLTKALIKSKGRVDGGVADGVAGEVKGLVSIEEAEFVVAALLFDSARADLRRAVRMLVEAEQSLPRGLLARAGRALARAAHRPQATDVLQRLAADRAILNAGDRWTAFPGESKASVLAAELELLLELDPKHPRRDGCVLDLLSGFRGGSFGSTYATGTALAALSREGAERSLVVDAKPILVTVMSGEQSYSIELSAKNHFNHHMPVAPDASVIIESQSGHELFATLVAATREVGSTHKGWAQPIRVERRVAGSLRQGEVTRVEIDVSSPRSVRYVVVDCPLPAGWEFVGEGGAWSVFDDRVVRTIPRLVGGKTAKLSFEIVPALAGRVGWLPTTASAMYVPRCGGGSPGLVVDIGLRGERRAAVGLATLLADGERYVPSPDEPPLSGKQLLAWLETFPEQYDEQHSFSVGSVLERSLCAALEPAETDSIITDDDSKPVDRDGWTHFFAAFLVDMAEAPTQYHYGVLSDRYYSLDSTARQGSAMSPDRTWLHKASREFVSDGVHLLAVGLASGDKVLRDRCAALLFYDLALIKSLEDRSFRDTTFRLALLWAMDHKDRWEDWERAVEDGFPENTADRELQLLCLGLLSQEESELNWEAFVALPSAVRQHLPAAMFDSVSYRLGGDDYLQLLLQSSGGRQHLRVCMRDAEWRSDFADSLASCLTSEQWLDAPLEFFKSVVWEDAFDFNFLAKSTHSNAALLAAYQQAEQGEWEQALLSALAARGVRQIENWPEAELNPDEEEAVDPALPCRRQLAEAYLAAVSGDFDASLILREILWAFRHPDESEFWSEVPDLEEIVLEGLVDHLTEREFVEESFELDVPQQRRVLRRFGVERTLALLNLSLDEDSELILEHSAIPFLEDRRIRDAIWDDRSPVHRHNDDLIDVLSRTRAHAMELRQRIEGLSDQDERMKWAKMFVSIANLPIPELGQSIEARYQLQRHGLRRDAEGLSQEVTKALHRRGLWLSR